MSKKKKKTVRIHESGDFYNRAYVLKWFKIAAISPEKTFYAYTKRTDIFTEELLKLKPRNFILNLSLDKIQDTLNFDVPYGYDNVVITHKFHNTCPAMAKKEIKCVKNCKKCLKRDKKAIFFKKH